MTLKLHHLRPAPGAKTAKTRVGRGEGSKGKTAGRGTKGTKARNQVPAHFEGGQMPIHMRLPKLKGFKNPFKVEYQVVNLDRLDALFPEGGSRRRRGPGRQGRGPRRPAGEGARLRRALGGRRGEARTRSPPRPRRRSPPPAAAPPSSEPGCRARSGPGPGDGADRDLARVRPTGGPLLGFRGRRAESYPADDRAREEEEDPGARRIRQRVPDAGPATQVALRAAGHRGVPARLADPDPRRQRHATCRPASRPTKNRASTA